MCQHAPGSVDVLASNGKQSRGPVEFIPRTRIDENASMIEEVEQILTIPASHLSGIAEDAQLTLTDDDGVSRKVRVHRRRPALGEGHGYLHELALVDA